MTALATQHLLPAERRDIDLRPVDIISEHAAGRVGEGQALAGFRDKVRVRHADAAGGAVPGEQHVVRPVDLAEVGQLAIIGADDGGVDLELLDGIRHPAFTEAFPRERGHGSRAQHRPHRHLERARVAARHDADAVRVRQVKQLAHQVDAILQALLADL
ncbi:hypothetical protein WR25_16934 [Diploscapter pachys]|uniref:Uncharacterized protein n=1 Tax=Diploscapter pachys TaxID=2018661 RepID=A0A2A2M2J3_9BILA|nr:hypothetical protein WR25_16934 [Diploscapter pachys]